MTTVTHVPRYRFDLISSRIPHLDLPRALKFVALLLFLVNARSWPLVWHYKVLVEPIFAIRARYHLHRLSTLFLPAAIRQERRAEWLKKLGPVGQDPLSFEIVQKGWVGPDDADFNLHLSNSSYPRMLDAARFKGALKMWPTFFRAGGWMALAGTHFRFIKEIPIFWNYELRIRVVAWDEKWLYVVIRFVSLPKKGKKKSHGEGKNDSNISSGAETPAIKDIANVERTSLLAGQDKDNDLPSGDSAPLPSLHTPASGMPSRSVSFVKVGSALMTSTSANTDANINGDDQPKIDFSSLSQTPEPDGATVHCVSVSVLCFKIGRITIPPAVVFGIEGFSRLPSPAVGLEQPKRYDHANPPPGYLAAYRALQEPDLAKGHLKTLQRYMKQGWREVQEWEKVGSWEARGKRWWEDALSEEVEARRKVNLAMVKGVREGMEGAAACLW